MRAFENASLLQQREATGKRCPEHLRAPRLNRGIHDLPGGGVDAQQPRAEDAVYDVLAGHGQVRVAADDRLAGPGSIIFVAAQVEHRFHSITEDPDRLMFFAPAESR